MKQTSGAQLNKFCFGVFLASHCPGLLLITMPSKKVKLALEADFLNCGTLMRGNKVCHIAPKKITSKQNDRIPTCFHNGYLRVFFFVGLPKIDMPPFQTIL